MRYIFLIISLIIVLTGARFGFCDWEEMIQVNTNNYDKQASRDFDCPWPIAADDSGNVYTVWEDNQTDDLEVYFRKRNYDGTWDSQEKISNEETISVPNYGHPSICVIPGPYPTKLLTCYVREHDGGLPRELRGNTFDGDQWGDPSYYISDDDSDPNYVLPNHSYGWGTNIVALSDGKTYAFWQYAVGSNVKLYLNEFDDGWEPDYEKVVYDDGGASTHYSRHENACVDSDDKIHLVYADNYSGNNEIYYLYRGTQDDDFGYYPGYQISSSPANTHSVFPYCAVSKVADTTFLHVVWSTDPTALIYYRNWNSVTSTWSAITDTIVQYIITRAEKPSVACDSYGNVHVVWQKNFEDDSYDVVEYRKFDYALGEWGTVITLPADEEEIDAYAVPVIISDVYDNLHVLMTGRRVGVEATDEEVYYSFWDAPPHAPQNLAQVFIGPLEYITITWDANSEPDMDGFMIIRRYHEKTYLDTLATVDDTVTTYVDTEIPHVGGETPNYVRYWIEAIDTAGQHSPKSDSLECAVPKNWEPPKLMADGSIPTRFELTGNYPNPFNARTTIEYNVPYEMEITVEIYDILGRKVETLIDDFQSPGSHAVIWDASHIASGMYFYRLQAGEYSETKRMTIIK